MHGDHRVVIDMECSYCKTGLNERRPLGSPRTRGELAEKIESNCEEKVTDEACPQEVDGHSLLPITVNDPLAEFDDVLDCDFGDGFNLSDELWQYA